MVPVATSVSADETEALKAEITKAVEKVQEAGEMKHLHTLTNIHSSVLFTWQKICLSKMNMGLFPIGHIHNEQFLFRHPPAVFCLSTRSTE